MIHTIGHNGEGIAELRKAPCPRSMIGSTTHPIGGDQPH
jgi:hypothetical protein